MARENEEGSGHILPPHEEQVRSACAKSLPEPGGLQGAAEFLGKSVTGFPSRHGTLRPSGLPDWELAVTILVSTVPFLGMGSVLEQFWVGLTLAHRLPLSKRLTSPNSVPVEEPPDRLLGRFYPESNCSGRDIYGTLNAGEDGICFTRWDILG